MPCLFTYSNKKRMLKILKPRRDDRSELKVESKPEFKSSFKTWIRVVAFIVVAIFLPEQVAHAVEFDWRVLWNKPAIGGSNAFTPGYIKDIHSVNIPLTIKNILLDISKQPVTSIRVSDKLTLDLDKPLVMSKQRIEEIYQWLQGKPCGSKALYDYLSYQKAHSVTGAVLVPEEQDIAVMALTIDILNDVVRPEGNPEVIKNSLYALSKASEFFGQELYAVKADISVLRASVPFIAQVNGEHFVLVTKISEDKVYYTDNHKEEFLPESLFAEAFTGYVLLNVLPAGVNVLDDVESKSVMGSKDDGFNMDAARANPAVASYRSQVMSSLRSDYRTIEKAATKSITNSIIMTGVSGLLGGLSSVGALGNWLGSGSYMGMNMATRWAITGAAAGFAYNGVTTGKWFNSKALLYTVGGAAAGYGLGYSVTNIPWVTNAWSGIGSTMSWATNSSTA